VIVIDQVDTSSATSSIAFIMPRPRTSPMTA